MLFRRAPTRGIAKGLVGLNGRVCGCHDI
jgi:hypothetical protein